MPAPDSLRACVGVESASLLDVFVRALNDAEFMHRLTCVRARVCERRRPQEFDYEKQVMAGFGKA